MGKLFFVALLLMAQSSFCQNQSDFQGTWKLKNIIIMVTSDSEDKVQENHRCRESILNIQKGTIVFSVKKNCFLNELIHSNRKYKMLLGHKINRSDSTSTFSDLFQYLNDVSCNNIDLINTDITIANSDIENAEMFKYNGYIYFYLGFALLIFGK